MEIERVHDLALLDALPPAGPVREGGVDRQETVLIGWGTTRTTWTPCIIVHAVAAGQVGLSVAMCGAPLSVVSLVQRWSQREVSDMAECGRCIELAD
jgi:hypothetical protein